MKPLNLYMRVLYFAGTAPLQLVMHRENRTRDLSSAAGGGQGERTIMMILDMRKWIQDSSWRDVPSVTNLFTVGERHRSNIRKRVGLAPKSHFRGCGRVLPAAPVHKWCWKKN